MSSDCSIILHSTAVSTVSLLLNLDSMTSQSYIRCVTISPALPSNSQLPEATHFSPQFPLHGLPEACVKRYRKRPCWELVSNFHFRLLDCGPDLLIPSLILSLCLAFFFCFGLDLESAELLPGIKHTVMQVSKVTGESN